MGTHYRGDSNIFEPTPAPEINFDDIGPLRLVGRKLWFPMFVRRPCSFGTEITNHVVAWGVSSPDVISDLALRAMDVVGIVPGREALCLCKRCGGNVLGN